MPKDKVIGSLILYLLVCIVATGNAIVLDVIKLKVQRELGDKTC